MELDLPSRRMLPHLVFLRIKSAESTGFWSSSAQTGLELTAIGSGVLSDKVPSGIWGVFFPVSSACDHTFPNMDHSSEVLSLSQWTTLREGLWSAFDPCWCGGGVEAFATAPGNCPGVFAAESFAILLSVLRSLLRLDWNMEYLPKAVVWKT